VQAEAAKQQNLQLNETGGMLHTRNWGYTPTTHTLIACSFICNFQSFQMFMNLSFPSIVSIWEVKRLMQISHTDTHPTHCLCGLSYYYENFHFLVTSYSLAATYQHFREIHCC
jgi:hypothetical protein